MRHQVTAPKIIQEKDNWRLWLKLLFLIIVFVLVSIFSFDYGRERAGFDIVKARDEKKKAKKYIVSLKAEVDDLKRQVATDQRAAQVDRRSVLAVRIDLQRLSDENASLKDQIAFFRGIVAPEEQKKGMSIQSLQIKSGEKIDQFRYRVIVTRFGSSKKASEGVVKINIEGLQNGVAKTLTLRDFNPKKIASHPYKLKYFKRMTGEMHLPKGFKPNFVEVVVDPKGSWPKPTKSRYTWVVSEK